MTLVATCLNCGGKIPEATPEEVTTWELTPGDYVHDGNPYCDYSPTARPVTGSIREES